MRTRAFVSGAFAFFFAPGLAQSSEPMPVRAERLPLPGRSSTTEESTESILQNPANLARLPAWELRWAGLGCHNAPRRVQCGNTFAIATPLPFGLGVGFRVDWVQPPTTAVFPFGGNDYTWATVALSHRASESLSFGLSMQRSYSEAPFLDGLLGLSASATYAPTTRLAFSAGAHDFNGPSRQKIGPTGLPVLDSSYALALSFRPTGRRAFELGVDLRYLAGSEQLVPRASLGIDIPGVGRARGDVQAAHLPSDERRGIVGSAGLELNWGYASLGAGVLGGSGLGRASSLGEYGTVAFSGFRSPGLPRAHRSVSFRFEKTPGVYTHIDLLRRLWKVAEDPSVDGVALVMRTEPATSFAHAEELADAVRVLRAHGKKVLCSLEDNGPRALYVCANTDRIVMNPAGGLRFAGLKAQYIYLAGLLSKIGVRADILRISEHKTAPEMFTNEEASDTARADHENALRQVESVFYRNLAKGRRMTDEEARAVIARGPFVAHEARASHLVDQYAFDDELDRAMSDLLGRRTSLEKYEDEVLAHDTFGARSRLGLLVLEGDMIDGRSETIPLIGNRLLGSYTIADAAKQLREDKSVRAVVLRIESPGGSSMAADVMWRELVLLAKKKPLIVSMGSVAASGGYYVAVAGKTIYALPLTVTGSIGVFYGKADLSELLKKIGVNVETYKTAPRADAESMYRPFTEDERRELTKKIQQFYDVFLDRVAEGRKMTKESVDAVGGGRVWTGQEALQRHLVDKLGGLRDALGEARAAAGLPEDAPILTIPSREPTLVERALKLAGFGQATVTMNGFPLAMTQVLRALVPFAVHQEDKALAHMDAVPLDLLEVGTDE